MAIVVNGLNQNNYFINNPIIITLSQNDVNMTSVAYFGVTLTNSNTGKTATIKLYPNPDNKITFDLSPSLKGLFDSPQRIFTLSAGNSTNTSQTFNIGIGCEYYIGDEAEREDIIISNKIFVRGGVNDNRTNINIGNNSVLSPIDKIAYWTNLSGSIIEYKLVNGQVIGNRNSSQWTSKKVLKYNNFCDYIVITFLNSFGGYSTWLFEITKETFSNSNLGYVDNISNFTDLGNELNTSINVKTKFTSDFLPLMQDLIISPDIQMQIKRSGEAYKTPERIISDNNTLQIQHADSAMEVSFKFRKINKYNPSVVW